MSSVLVIGGGGREHSIAWRLKKDQNVEKVWIAPGNAADFPKPDVDINDIEAVIDFCGKNNIKLIIVGPEAPLSDGFVDKIGGRIEIFGPTKEAAQLESSKIFSKLFMREFQLPTADFEYFDSIQEAEAFIDRCEWHKIVVKADGLAAGKGVIVANSKQEAKEAARTMLQGAFGASGQRIIIEKGLDGYEVSALCFTDGKTFRRMPLIRDHKRLLDGDHGPNTGGMGVVGPVTVPKEVDARIDSILQRTIDGLNNRQIEYIGVIYAGFMITNNEPQLLEYNCRFGDPETEILMRMLKTSLFDICHACAVGKLEDYEIDWKETFACGVILATDKYPASGDKGTPIFDIPEETSEVVVFHCGTAKKDGQVVTNGGRILCATAIGPTLESAQSAAVQACKKIKFAGKFFRRDIGRCNRESNFLSYSDSGVNINEGNAFVDGIKNIVKSTLKPGTGEIGGFGALVDFEKAGYSRGSQIVVGIDGVGTKIEIADAVRDYSKIGYDVVAMCVNDVLCHGAAPIAFLDYFVCGKLDRAMATEVVGSIANACKESDCSLVGGETAEMPGVYNTGQWDLAGCAIAVREPQWPLLPNPNSMEVNDVLIGLPSSGVHSNGFSLVRKVLAVNRIKCSDPTPWDNTKTFGEVLLTPTRLYVKSVLPLLKEGLVKGCAHITGGGIKENAIRVLNSNGNLAMEVNASSWTKLPLFNWLASAGPVSDEEMLTAFNSGIGMILVVSQENMKSVIQQLTVSGEKPEVIGKIVQRNEGSGLISFTNLSQAFDRPTFAIQRRKVRVGILISGSGTNMLKLIERAAHPGSNCEIVLVISNKEDAGGLKLAKERGIPTTMVKHTVVREEGDRQMTEKLREAGVEMICAAGYMRILSPEFVHSWEGRILNIHPSLLPSFKGAHAVRDAIQFGAKITGCTVHVVDELVDNGAIVAQSAVNISDEDNEESLHKKIQVEEHRLYPEAMEIFAGRLLDL